MRPYYIFSGIHLILPIVYFAVAAPLLVQEKPRADLDVAQIPEDVTNVLGKRAGEFDDLFDELFGRFESRFFPNPEAWDVVLPSSSSHMPGPTGGPTDFEKPLPSIHEESLRMLRQDHQPPIPGGEWIKSVLPLESGESSVAPPSSDYVRLLQYIHGIPPSVFSLAHLPPSLGPEWNKMWDNMIETHFPPKPEEPPDARPPSEPADGLMNAKQPLPFTSNEPLVVSSPDHALQIPGYEPNKLLLNHFKHPESYILAKPDASSSAHWDSSSTLQRPGTGSAGGSTDSETPQPSIHEEPLPLFFDVHLPPSLGDDWNKMQDNPVKGNFPSKLGPLSKPADRWMGFGKQLSPILEEPSPVSSPDYLVSSPESLTDAGYELMKGDAAGPSGPTSPATSSVDHELMGTHAMPNPSPSTGSGHEMVPPPPSASSSIESDNEPVAAPSGSVSSTNPEGQSVGVGPSSGKRKRP